MNRLRELAAEAFESRERDCDLAVQDVIAKVNADASLYREVTAPLLEYAARNEVETIMRSTRPRYWPQTSPRSDTLRGLRQRAEKNLLDYPLAGGKPIGDYTGSELKEYGKSCIERGKTEIVRGHWCVLVANFLPASDAVVRKELRDADLRRLQKKAEKDCGDLNPVANGVPNVAVRPNGSAKLLQSSSITSPAHVSPTRGMPATNQAEPGEDAPAIDHKQPSIGVPARTVASTQAQTPAAANQ